MLNRRRLSLYCLFSIHHMVYSGIINSTKNCILMNYSTLSKTVKNVISFALAVGVPAIPLEKEVIVILCFMSFEAIVMLVFTESDYKYT